MEKFIAEGFKLSTGKVIYPKCIDGILLYELVEGDGGTPGNYSYEVTIDHHDSPDLTKEEANEFALYMSQLWLQWVKNLK